LYFKAADKNKKLTCTENHTAYLRFFSEGKRRENDQKPEIEFRVFIARWIPVFPLTRSREIRNAE